MYRLEMYAILARDRQREVLEQLRLNALLRERATDSEAIHSPIDSPGKPEAKRRQPASGSAMAEARVVEGNR